MKVAVCVTGSGPNGFVEISSSADMIEWIHDLFSDAKLLGW